MPRGRLDQGTRQDLATLPTTTGVLSRLAAERAIHAGIDVNPLLKEVDLSTGVVEDPDSRVGVGAQIAFLNLVADALQDRWLGFHLARDSDLREFGPFYYLMASSPRLGEAMDCAVRFGSVVNEGIRIYRSSRLFTIEFDYVGAERHADIHQIEFWITCTLRMSRLFAGRELIPSLVRFLHHRDGDAAEIQRYFGGDLMFGADRDSIAFDPGEADLPNVTADPFLHRFLLEYYEDAVVRSQSKQSSLRTRVENAITSRLPNGTAIIGNIASDLGMSSRTLSRRLAEEGSTFSGILDELRSSLANRYLQNNELSISQIAWLLGYTEVSSFAHAFQRWTGKSPTSARRQIARMGDADRRQSSSVG
jgi:AraC-like DNA-binding protein